MASLYISEYRLEAKTEGRLLSAPQEPAAAEQAIDITAGSLQSAAFQSRVTFVMIMADADCCLAFGEDPTAVNTLKKVREGERIFKGVQGGHKVAVIAAA